MDLAIRERYVTLAEAVDRLGPSPEDPELHAVRILAKPARYAAELGAGLLETPCARFARRVTDLCDTLGQLNDGAKAGEWLDGAVLAGLSPLAVGRVEEWDRWQRRGQAGAAAGSAPPPPRPRWRGGSEGLIPWADPGRRRAASLRSTAVPPEPVDPVAPTGSPRRSRPRTSQLRISVGESQREARSPSRSRSRRSPRAAR